ncbi:MAG TPA: 2-succinyl-5-enolpyruvyl-6-hydroxy-3-cyclohexene-1-carboxylic-acid synthase [bacterium]|nr:2-succinyl-5-enolpyruvyl-6-hydroxy-3-cyclohexene-1-carboxylic-acid synthase [bacterium]
MNHEDVTYAYIGALIDELARSGIAHLCLCPGSRSTPLALCAARHPGIRAWTLIDERSAAFFALGLAKASRAPVAVLSTSGTAAANFLPAVVEACYGRVPLIALTADRPHELRDSGANQTIDQLRLFGPHAKWFADLALPEATDAALRYVRSLAAQAVAAARALPAGPVHLNVPLREPLMPALGWDARPTDDRGESREAQGRPAGRPYTAVAHAILAPDPGAVAALADELRVERGLIVCGPADDPSLPAAVSRLAAATGYPILADPLSQVRCGPHDRSHVVDSYDAFLRLSALADALVPDIVIRMGGLPASRPLQQYLQRHTRSRHVVIESGGGWNDPLRLASDMIQADARLLCDSLVARLQPRGGMRPPTDAPWPALWRRLGREAREAVNRQLGATDEPFEGKVFSELAAVLPDGATLYVGNSMPVRDLETFFPSVPTAIRILGNRGASGIDGLVSSGLGAAAAGGGPLVLVLGDLAFYHDLNGLLAARLHGLRAAIVLLNNDGGGIFSFMPQAAIPEHFETLFGTPTGLEFKFAAELYGAGFIRADDWTTFRNSVRGGLASKGLDVIEIRTGRDRNVALHREVWAAVEEALSSVDVERAPYICS